MARFGNAGPTSGKGSARQCFVLSPGFASFAVENLR